jgi:hypothetical protein
VGREPLGVRGRFYDAARDFPCRSIILLRTMAWEFENSGSMLLRAMACSITLKQATSASVDHRFDDAWNQATSYDSNEES